MFCKINKNESGYNLWSSFYDQYPNPTVAIDELSFPGFYIHLQGQKVLEVGCGTGRHTLRLLAAGNLVTGVDISEGMLNQLRQKTNTPKLTLIQGNFLDAEITGAPFNAMIASLVLEHISELPEFFKRARDLMNVGGELFISDLHPQRTGSGIFAHFKDLQGHEISLESFAHKAEEIRNAAEQNGFMIEKVESVLGNEKLASINEKWRRYLDLPMIQIWSMKAIV